jgi:3-deoxy-D-manno-octulosonic-acid transferase
MRRRYDLFYVLGALVSSPVLAFGLLRTGKWRTDWKGRFGSMAPLPADPRPTLLLHGVSVGEINATRELVARLTAPESPPLRLVVSATTNTGFARAQELYGDRLAVVRFPFDLSWMVSRFLDAVRPDAVVLMELEVWPNLAQLCQLRRVPLAVINGRLSDSSFRRYRLVRPFVGTMFRTLSAVGAQTEEYARRFRGLGVPEDRITVTDTMKWDTVKLVEEVPGAEALRLAMGIDPERPLVVAGSTGPGEEDLLLAGRPEGVQLMLVPRRPERFEEVARLAPGMVRRTRRPDGTQGEPSPEGLFLLDTMGELTKAYALADVAVVGRSFVPMGGSDPIEAIALGKPTVMGPHHDNFREVVSALVAAGGIRVTEAPMEEVVALLDDPQTRRRMGEAGRSVIRERKGATGRNAELLHGLVGSALEGRSSGRDSQEPSAHRRRTGFFRRWILPALLLYMAAGYLTTAFRRVTFQDGGPPTIPLPAFQGRLLSGVFSVHTDRSHDATGTREEVAEAAAAAGLDFVVVGDHPPDARKPGWAFWDPVFLDGVLIEGGQELRSPEAGKILAVSVDTTYRRWEGDYASFVEMLRRDGATSFVVHGRGPRGSERWVSPSVEGIQGWEVLDISEFARNRFRGFWSLYHGLTVALGAPLGLGDEALLHLMREGFDTPTVAAYDSFRVLIHESSGVEPSDSSRMAASLTATAGLNVHPKVRVGSVLVPSYGLFFPTLVTHVVVGSWPYPDPSGASASLMAGARTGDAFISLGGGDRARFFRMGVWDGGSAVAGMGASTHLSGSTLLRAGFEEDPGRKLLYRILRDGEEVVWILGPGLEWQPPEAGVYRVEVYTYSARLGRTFFQLRPWVFGNPVELLPLPAGAVADPLEVPSASPDPHLSSRPESHPALDS